MIPLDTLTALHSSLASLLAAIDADFINGAIEAVAGFFVLNHCRVLHAHKETRGVSIVSAVFFLLWGFWNLYYYPHLNQPISFYGGLFVVAANVLYIGMMVRYRIRTAPIDDVYFGSGK